MNDPIITRTLIKRPWSDVEQKIVWGGTAGGIMLILLLAFKGQIDLNPIVEQAAPYIMTILAGYIVPSAGQTITSRKPAANGDVIEQKSTSGAAVTVLTSPTPVQAPAPTAVAPSFTDVVDNTPAAEDAKPTEVIPGTTLPGLSRGASFLNTLPSSQSIDGH